MLKDFLEIKKHKTIWIEEGQGDKVEEIIHYREKSKMEKREKKIGKLNDQFRSLFWGEFSCLYTDLMKKKKKEKGSYRAWRDNWCCKRSWSEEKRTESTVGWLLMTIQLPLINKIIQRK